MTSYHFTYEDFLEQLVPLLIELEVVAATESLSAPSHDDRDKQLRKILKKYPKPDKQVFSKDEILKAYRQLAGTNGLHSYDAKIAGWLTMKPVRTMSGVTPVTVLTKPFPCPGTCIFCPNDIRMPKSYLADEPGAQRAERNYFDPYLQTYTRLQAFHNIGHAIDKVELIILGGTWSYYPEPYQIWFIKECFRALNEFGITDSRIEIEKRYQEMSKVYQEMERHSPTNDPQLNQDHLSDHQLKGESLHKTYNQTVSELYVAPERLAGFDAYQSASWQELENQQKLNETANSRSVGLVIETRPDNISEKEVLKIRRLGCTKTQIGFA